MTKNPLVIHCIDSDTAAGMNNTAIACINPDMHDFTVRIVKKKQIPSPSLLQQSDILPFQGLLESVPRQIPALQPRQVQGK